MYIYCIKLENNKYYVGRTNNIERRMNEHLNNNGSEWTKIHKPIMEEGKIAIDFIIQTDDPFDEDKHVKKCMAAYGIDNVRGGSYSQINLTNNTKFFISKEISNSEDKCFVCKGSGHFAKNCRKQQETKEYSPFEDSCVLQ